jgi:ADP-ribosylation factor-like protein 5B
VARCATETAARPRPRSPPPWRLCSGACDPRRAADTRPFFSQVGLDNAGKTTVLYRLHLGATVATSPTLGCNVEKVAAGGSRFEVWDLGGQANLRPSWAAYYGGADAVIVVVDSTDRARAGVAKGELFALLADARVARAPVLVLANKQDAAGAMGVPELTAALSLHSVQRHDWHVQASCALTGEGLAEGLEWVAARVAAGGAGGGSSAAVPVPAAPAQQSAAA